MNNCDRAEKILDDLGMNLIYPYHIDHTNKTGRYYYNENYTEFHTHDFNSLIIRASEEPKAFILTAEDKTYYSYQELKIIETIKTKI